MYKYCSRLARFQSLAALLLVAGAQSATAISFLVFDPDSMAMGGAGAATNAGRYRPWSNPAGQSDTPESLDLSFYLGVRAIDRQNFIDTFEQLREVEEELQIKQQLDAARSAFDGGDLDASRLRRLSTTADRVVTEVQNLPDKPLRITAAAAIHLVAQRPRWAGGIYVRHYRVLGGRVENDLNDLLRIQQLADTSRAMADVIEGAQRIERLVHDVDWPVLEDLIRESIETREMHEQLQNYREIPGVSDLVDAFRGLDTNLTALDQFVDLDGLYNTVRRQQANLQEVDAPLTTLPDVNLPDVDPPHNEAELEALIEDLNLAIESASLAAFLDQLEVDLPLEILPLRRDLNVDNLNWQEFLRYPVPDVINTQLIFSGAEVTESALSLSRQIDALPNLTLGVTVKHLSYTTIAYRQRVDEFDLDAYRHGSALFEHRLWNLDIGARYQFGPHWTLGLVAKNLHRKHLADRMGATVSIEPIVRAGAAFETHWLRLAIDYDLTRNEPLGFDPDKQYLSAGIELIYWRNQSVRLGYRYNLVDHSRLPSAGLHFRAGAAYLDLAGTYSENNREAGLALQVGLSF